MRSTQEIKNQITAAHNEIGAYQEKCLSILYNHGISCSTCIDEHNNPSECEICNEFTLDRWWPKEENKDENL